jgi:hypothetical protein
MKRAAAFRRDLGKSLRYNCRVAQQQNAAPKKTLTIYQLAGWLSLLAFVGVAALCSIAKPEHGAGPDMAIGYAYDAIPEQAGDKEAKPHDMTATALGNQDFQVKGLLDLSQGGTKEFSATMHIEPSSRQGYYRVRVIGFEMHGF